MWYTADPVLLSSKTLNEKAPLLHSIKKKMIFYFERFEWKINLFVQDDDEMHPVLIQSGDIDLHDVKRSSRILIFFSCRNPLLYILADGSRTRCKTGLVRINWSRRQETTESLWLRPFNSRIKVRIASSECRIFKESRTNSKFQTMP